MVASRATMNFLKGSVGREQQRGGVLRVRREVSSGTVKWIAVAESRELEGASDGSILVEDLWSTYSIRAMERFRRAFDKEDLEVDGIPAVVMEHHLLTEIYRNHAFAALLADELARWVEADAGCHEGQDGEFEVLVRLPPTAGDLSAVASKFCRASSNRGTPEFMRWAGFAAGLAACSAGVLRLAVRAEKAGSAERLPQLLFLVFSDDGTHTRHVWACASKMIQEGRDCAVLLLGQRIPRLPNPGPGLRLKHAMSAKDLPASIIRFVRSARAVQRLHRIAERDLRFRLSFSFQFRAAAWFLRGLLHQSWFDRVRLAGRTKA